MKERKTETHSQTEENIQNNKNCTDQHRKKQTTAMRELTQRRKGWEYKENTPPEEKKERKGSSMCKGKKVYQRKKEREGKTTNRRED